MNENLQEMIQNLQTYSTNQIIIVSGLPVGQDSRQIIQSTTTKQLNIKTTNSCIMLFDGKPTANNLICTLNYSAITNITTNHIQSSDTCYKYILDYSLTSTTIITYTITILPII